MVLDEPQSGDPSPNAAVKPANESRTSAPSAKQMTVYIDGQFLPESEAKVSVFDHGLLYGDGVFEGIRFYNGASSGSKSTTIASGIRRARSASRSR
jgi:hypothetical protein